MNIVHLLRKSVFYILFSVVFWNGAVAEPEKEDLSKPLLIVELDNFGFKADLLWYQFEKGFLEAAEELKLPYRFEFKKYPVKDYYGNSALEIRLNFWRLWRTGEREINFWSTYVHSGKEKIELDIISNRNHVMEISYSQLERNLQKSAYDATKKMFEKLKEKKPDFY